MAIYENLPVYKESYDLLLEVHLISKNMSREHRFTICERLKERVMDLMLSIYNANANTNTAKEEYLKRAREYVVEIKLYIRLLRDLKQISINKVAEITEKMESISKQLTAWTKSIK